MSVSGLGDVYKRQGKDPDKGDKILGDPIKFTVTVTPWNPTDNNINM